MSAAVAEGERRLLQALRPTGAGLMVFGFTLAAVVVALVLSGVLIATTGSTLR